MESKATDIKEKFKRFYTGPIYPAFVALLILASHTFGLEFWFNIVNVLLFIGALLLCDTLRPFIVVLCSYVYQFSTLTNINNPSGEDFYYSGVRLGVIIALFVLAILALCIFLWRNGFVNKKSLAALPMPFAAIALSVAFLLNGAFSGSWSLGSLGYGAVQIVTFFVIMYVFTIGLKNEKGEELMRYFAYVSAILLILLIVEMIFVYATSDEIFKDGTIVKDRINFGWGNWNTVGQHITMMIPLAFYGVMKNKYPWFYFAVATLATIAAILTMSRNALLISAAVYVGCIIACCFIGKEKRVFRFLLPAGVLLLIIAAIILREKIMTLLDDYIQRGLSDNGRFDLWHAGIDAFMEAPVFGKGFFGVFPPESQDGGIFPVMVHNTPVQLLASMGVFGTAAYIYYRVETLRPFIFRPTVEKTMLAVSLLVVIIGSLLDNFVFYYHHMLYYPIVLAIAYKLSSEEKEKSTALNALT